MVFNSKVFGNFARDENGAVTVDWVVLTAALVGLAIAAVSVIAAGAMDTSTGIGAHLEAMTLATY